MTKIGFIGLGHMGHPMANNLLRAGFQVVVYDVVITATYALAQEGATVANSLGELAAQVEIVITSVQTGEQVQEISAGLFPYAKPGLLYIDCSSIDIAVTRELHQQAEKLNIAMLDAPVSGGVAAAMAATLTIMVGGTETAFQRALPILQKLGKKVIHAGPAGHGQAAKICNNLLLGISMIGVSEAFNLAKKLGLDQKKFFEISSNASGQCWSMTSYCPVPDILPNVPSSHQYEPGFMAKMMLKDLLLGKNAAEIAKAYIPLGIVATKLYEHYVAQGEGEKDFSGIINLIENK